MRTGYLDREARRAQEDAEPPITIGHAVGVVLGCLVVLALACLGSWMVG